MSRTCSPRTPGPWRCSGPNSPDIPNSRYYVIAEVDGEIAGYAGMMSQPGSAPGAVEGWVQNIAVARAHQGRGLGAEIEAIELHDAMAPAELILYERLGLCGPGEGPRLIDDRITTLGGRQPVNPSGGLCSRGHPVGATGLLQICELVWQMRGEAGSAPDRAAAESHHGAKSGRIAAGSGLGSVRNDDPRRRESRAPAGRRWINFQCEGNVSKKRKEVVSSIKDAASQIKDGMTVAVGGIRRREPSHGAGARNRSQRHEESHSGRVGDCRP